MPEIKNCETCGKEYRANSNGRFCSSRCYEKTRPSQYQKMRSEITALKRHINSIEYYALEGYKDRRAAAHMCTEILDEVKRAKAR